MQSLTCRRRAARGPREEIWVFDPAPAIRVVTLEGLASIDPSQTQLPPEWMSLATYAAKPGDTLKLVEQRRGNADPEPDQLRLDRHLWLDVDGGGWTVRDSIQGGISRSWRLEMPAPTVLGRASVNGREQPLTRLGTAAAPGVEVRQGPLTLIARISAPPAARCPRSPGPTTSPGPWSGGAPAPGMEAGRRERRGSR